MKNWNLEALIQGDMLNARQRKLAEEEYNQLKKENEELKQELIKSYKIDHAEYCMCKFYQPDNNLNN